MTSRKKFPPRLLIGLLFAIFIETSLQVYWKVAVVDLPDGDGASSSLFASMLANPKFLLVIALMALQFFNWLVILAEADLSFAHPITAFSYVSVFVLSILYLNQKADPLQALGVALVLAGVWFISRTGHKTKTQKVSAP